MRTPFVLLYLSICSIEWNSQNWFASGAHRNENKNEKKNEIHRKNNTNAPLTCSTTKTTAASEERAKSRFNLNECDCVRFITNIAMQWDHLIYCDNSLFSSGTQAKFHNNWLKGTVGSTEIRARPCTDTVRFEWNAFKLNGWQKHSGSWKTDWPSYCKHINP